MREPTVQGGGQALSRNHGGVRRLALLVCLLTFLGSACGDGPEPPLADPEPAKGTEPVGRDFFFDPATYVGESITATAYVSEVIEPVAFRIAGERSLPKRDCDGVRSVPSLTRVAAERRPSKESPS